MLRFDPILCTSIWRKNQIRHASFRPAALGEDVVWDEAWESHYARE